MAMVIMVIQCNNNNNMLFRGFDKKTGCRVYIVVLQYNVLTFNHTHTHILTLKPKTLY